MVQNNKAYGDVYYNIASNFSENPGGRLRMYSENSGEELCEELEDHIRLAQNNKFCFVVEMGGTSGMCDSFLEEAFGGLIRMGLKYELLKDILILRDSEDQLYDKRAWKYIKEAYDCQNRNR